MKPTTSGISPSSSSGKKNAIERINYVNFERFAQRHAAELQTIASRVIASGTYVGGDEVAAFESDFAAYCGTAHAVGVANGQDALALTLRAWHVGPGSEVIVPANTAMPTALAVEHAGAALVLVDVDDGTGGLDPAALERAITPRTAVVIAVHLYGIPVDTDAIAGVTIGRGVRVLEDAAHAHGARSRGRRCGQLGRAGAFSFYPTKNLGAFGDAGAVTTDDADLASRLRSMRNCGLSESYDHTVIGFNSRLDPLQAAILRWKLPQLDAWNRRRRELADRYRSALGDIHELRLPTAAKDVEPVWHAFPVRIRDGRRDALARSLAACDIASNTHYRRPIHLQTCFAGRWMRGDFPISESRADEQLSLPLDPFHTDEEIDRVAEAIRTFFTR